MADELVNELTGEVLAIEDHLAAQRALEREIGKLDRAIADNKAESKDLKLAREKAVKDLRATVRDMKALTRPERRRRK